MRKIVYARLKNRLPWLLLFSVLMIISVAGFNVSANSITVEVSSSVVSAEETFSIAIYLNASEPVKSFECSISFNKNAFSVDSVNIGDYFEEYVVQNKFYFNSGIIDNQAGIVSQLWGLILGPGNVTGSGTILYLNCTAKDPSSDLTSSIVLSTAGITNETQYLDISIVNASILIDVDETLTPPPSNPPSGGGGGGLPPEEPVLTNPPQISSPPSGPTNVLVDSVETYSVSGWDSDGDTICFRMNWGDGSLSNWSEYVTANTTVLFTHQWMQPGNYSIQVTIQDITGIQTNSTIGLTVTVISDEPLIDPLLESIVVESIILEGNDSIGFLVISDELVNLSAYTIEWDFGDGTTGLGVNPDHIYEEPGRYNVTVTITDDQGENTVKTLTIIVPSTSEGSSESTGEDGGSVGWWLLIVGIIGSLAAAFIVFFKFFGISWK